MAVDLGDISAAIITVSANTALAGSEKVGLLKLM